jgi:DNA-binding SARP family transcriptional activator
MKDDSRASPLLIHLLGRFEVRVGATVVVDRSWGRSRAKTLLKRLALQSGRALHREQVLELLWPEVDPTAAGNNLRKNLHYLRAAFAAGGAGDPIVATADGVLSLTDVAWVDVDAFRAAGRAARSARDDPQAYEAALRLYAGDLLPEDIYEDWTAAAREELRALRRDLLGELAALHDARGERALAIERLQELLQADPAEEAAHRALMRLYSEEGSRHRALRQYERCREILDRELGVAPAGETQALRRRILEGPLGETPPDRPRQRARVRAAGALPAMYGREKELEIASEILDAAAEGRGQALFLAGPAGIGKTRLAQELLALAGEAGGLVLTGRSYPLEASVAYQPIREALRQLVEGGADSAARRAIESSLYLKRLLPHAAAETTVAADPALLRSELFAEAVQLFRTLAARRSVAVCFEDLHAADEASLRLMHVLGRELAHERVTLLGTYRAEDAAPGSAVGELVGSLCGAGLAQVLTLGPLAEGVMPLVVQNTFGDQPADPTLLRDIVRLAEGNPLFAHELVHTLTEEGWARLVDGRWERRGADQPPLPVAVREMVERRLRRLAEPGREVVAVASVLGRDFEYGLLHSAVAFPEREVLDALDDAIGAYLVEESPTGYRFRHDLVREAVYRGLTRARRQQLHRRVGMVLAESAAGAAADPEQISYHFTRSDEPWHAAPHLEAAARKAAALFANEQAIALYEQAVALARSGPAEPRRRAALLEALGDLKSRVGDAAASVDLLREALALVAEIGDEESVLRVRAKAALGLVVLGRWEEAAELLQAHPEDWRQLIAREFGQQSSRFGASAALQALANLRWHRGQHRAAREAAEHAVLAAEATGDVRRRARAYESLALACHGLGDWATGVQYELSRAALGLEGFESDIVLDSHL